MLVKTLNKTFKLFIKMNFFVTNKQTEECKKLNGQLLTLKEELNESKSQVVVAEYKRETEIQTQDRRAQEEIASLQHLVHGKINIL